jgi:hypothetical protein
MLDLVRVGWRASANHGLLRPRASVTKLAPAHRVQCSLAQLSLFHPRTQSQRCRPSQGSTAVPNSTRLRLSPPSIYCSCVCRRAGTDASNHQHGSSNSNVNRRPKWARDVLLLLAASQGHAVQILQRTCLETLADSMLPKCLSSCSSLGRPASRTTPEPGNKPITYPSSQTTSILISVLGAYSVFLY